MKRIVHLIVVLALVLAGQAPAQAKPESQPKVPGLILELPSSAQVSPALETLIQRSLGRNQFELRNIGTNWFSLKFPNELGLDTAKNLARHLVAARLVKVAQLDRRLQTFASHTGRTVSTPGQTKTAKPGVVRGLKVIDAYDPTRPLKAYLKASWQPPASMLRAKVLGYQVLVTTDFGKTFRLAVTSKSRVVQLGPEHGITNGVTVGVKVAAVAKVNGKSVVGVFSPISYQIPTGLPGKPQFKGDRIATVDKSPSWFIPSLEQAGGLPVTFTATAFAFAQPPVTCTTTSTTCRFEGLKPGLTYTVKLKATNAHGSSVADDYFVPADTNYPQQWYLGPFGIKADSAWEHTRGSSKIVVAVIDSGITSHPDLNDQLLRNQDGTIAGYDFVSQQVGSGDGSGWDSNPTDPSARNEWHGTLVSGVLAAAANGTGIVGVAPGVKLLQVRTMGETGGLVSDTVAAIYWAIGEKVKGVPINQNPAKVLNISIGNGQGIGCDPSAKAALALASKRGVAVITAAGNESKPTYFSFPGNCNASIDVAASSKTGDLASYSDFGPLVDLLAPGGDQSDETSLPGAQAFGILTTSNSGVKSESTPSYQYVAGTSFAAPQVAGVVALMLSLRSTLKPADIEAILKSTATKFAASSYCVKQAQDSPCGAGVVNASAAIDAVLNLP